MCEKKIRKRNTKIRKQENHYVREKQNERKTRARNKHKKIAYYYNWILSSLHLRANKNTSFQKDSVHKIK